MFRNAVFLVRFKIPCEYMGGWGAVFWMKWSCLCEGTVFIVEFLSCNCDFCAFYCWLMAGVMCPWYIFHTEWHCSLVQRHRPLYFNLTDISRTRFLRHLGFSLLLRHHNSSITEGPLLNRHCADLPHLKLSNNNAS